MTIWLVRRVVVAIHEIQLAEHGGEAGIRDDGLLDGALARPLNRVGYGTPDRAELAAVYALGIIQNHPFVDGNKRTGFAAMVLFLALNGVGFDPPEVEATVTILKLAGSQMGDEDFVKWVRQYCKVRSL